MFSIKKLTKNLEKRYWFFTLLCPLFMIGEVLLETAIPFLMAKIIDEGIAFQNMKIVLKFGAIMAVAAVISLFCGACGAIFSARASQGFSHNLRKNIFHKVMAFSFSNIDDFSTASLVTRLTTDVTNIQNVFQLIIRICFRAPFMLVSGTIMAFFINPRLALIFCFSIPILAIFIAVLSTKAYSRFAIMLEKYDKLNTIVQENLIAIRVVKAFVRGEKECEKFSDIAFDVKKTQTNAEKLVICLNPIMQFVVYLTIIAVFFFGGKMIVLGNMKTGELVSFLSYVMQILMSLMMIGMIFVNIVLSRASVRRVVEVLDEKIDIVSPENPITNVLDGSIEAENLSFSYSDKNDVLQNVSFSIKSGETVGIIGGTGSAKSTLVSLISRLYDATSGKIKVSGVDVKNYSLEVLRDAVSVVLQKNVLFSGTITENLKWGDKNASQDIIEKACQDASADDFIETFSNGYETELGQGGVNLSGGQKQRLCIARALLKKPKILILDDSTSAVDTATEKKIQDALSSYNDMTKIIIAQRISSVKDCDVIFVLDDGKINGCGTHEKLLLTNKIYAEVNASQATIADADL